MTVAQITPNISYTENGVTLSFAAPFRYLAADQIEVRRSVGGIETVLAYGIAWNATPGPSDTGGTVTLAATVAGAVLKIRRVTPRVQQTDYLTGDSFPAETHEQGLDRAIMIAQELDLAASEVNGRAVLAAPGEAGLVLSQAALLAGTRYAVGTNPVTGALELFSAESLRGPPGASLNDYAVSPEAFGAVGNNVANDLPAWRAMYTYAKANGIKRCVCKPNATYAWWAPTLSPSQILDAFDVLGPCMFLTISHDFQIEGSFSTINLKAWNGTSIQATTQAIVGFPIWRGCAINVIGGTAGTSSFGIKTVSIKNLTVNGGVTRGAVAVDLSHKGFRVQDTGIGKLYFENVILENFGGEIWYIGAMYPTKVTLINCEGNGSNQSALNPSVGNLIAIGGQYGDAYLACEGLGGNGHHYIGTRFYNSSHTGWWGASGFNGTFGAVDFSQPTNLGSEAILPWITLNGVTFDNCGFLTVSSYARGDVKLVDTYLDLDGQTPGQLHDVKLDVMHVTHKVNMTSAVYIHGPPTTTTAYGAGFVKLPRDVQVKVSAMKTQYARDNGIGTAALFSVQGLIDQDTVTFEAGSSESMAISSMASALTMPRMIPGFPANVQSGSGFPDGSNVINTTAGGTTYAVAITSPRHEIINAGATGIVTLTIAAPYAAPGGYTQRQRCTLRYSGYSTAGTTFLFRKGGTNMALSADRRLLGFNDWLELEYDLSANVWREVGFYSATPDRCTVAQLPAAAAAYNGVRGFVTDANATLTAGIGAVVAGGGANIVPVICDGAAWRIA